MVRWEEREAGMVAEVRRKWNGYGLDGVGRGGESGLVGVGRG